MTTHHRLGPTWFVVLAAWLTGGCGSPAGRIETAPEPELGPAVAEVVSTNGMSANGMSANGMSANGMSANGMSANGMSANGLTAAALGAPAFGAWFNEAPATRAVFMKYLVRCAVPSGKPIVWRNPATRTTYVWLGDLGLAPGWTSGKPITTAEEEVLTACLAAHVNAYGLALPIAVEGADANGARTPVAPFELKLFPIREACFFGNLFTGEGVFAGIDHADWGTGVSTLRGCVFDYAAIGTARDCAPIQVVGVCDQLCQPDATGLGYTTCSAGGKSYRALATRIMTWETSTCGDGRCDAGERCGAGASWDACGTDCGACP